jgi:hypothetical protein
MIFNDTIIVLAADAPPGLFPAREQMAVRLGWRTWQFVSCRDRAHLPNCSRAPQSTRQVSNGPPDACWTAATDHPLAATRPPRRRTTDRWPNREPYPAFPDR